MARKYLWAQLLLIGYVAGVEQTCVWKDGSTAQGYAPCTNSSESTGNCCSIGDVCTYNGMCYGGVGLVYRGACINEWGGNCLTYCDDVSDEWVNFYPCPYANTGSSWGPQNWWCGPMGSTFCTNTSGHFVNMAPSVGVKILSSSTTASPSATGTSTKSITSGPAATGPSDGKTTPAPSTSNHDGAMIGLGVGLGVLVIICAAAGLWALRSYRKQKAQLSQFAAVSGAAPQEYYPPNTKEYTNAQGVYRQQEVAGTPVGAEMDAQRGPAELGSRSS